MSNNSMATANAVWFLIGPFGSTEQPRYLPIHTVPFVVGRREGLALTLPCKTVSSMHAELNEAGGAMVLRDLGSTNGTYVNGKRVIEPVALQEEDLVQFANQAYRVRRQDGSAHTQTVQDNVLDRALALVQFDKLMAERAVTPFFQPIVSMANHDIFAYEVLARSRLFGLETPKEMFCVAAQLNLEVELSRMLRWEGIQAGMNLPQISHLFLNTHPRESAEAGLIESLEQLRDNHPNQPLTLEIHESAVTNPAGMAEIRAALKDLNMGLAYDDFGAGQSRLNELIEGRPDYVKFDMSLIRDIDTAASERQEVLATLVHMVRNLGVLSLAEGVETQGESDTCVQMGFDLGQGYFYGRPAPPRKPSLPN